MKQTIPLLLLAALLLAACTVASAAEHSVAPIETGVDPEGWVLIPAGEFLSGLHNHPTQLDHDYEVMFTDVTNQQYASYLNQALELGEVKLDDQAVVGYYPGDEFRNYEHEEEILAGDYLHIPINDPGLRLDWDGGTFLANPGFENHPMVLVTWFGAKSYCEFYDWRLPSELEWEKAARGTDGRAFPWGDQIERQNANYYSSHDIFEKIFGKSGNTTPVGFYNGRTYDGYTMLDSASPFGLYDMAGNVWQWTADVYPDQHYRYLRGGSKDTYAYNLRIWTRNSAGPTYYSSSVGFRCARDK